MAGLKGETTMKKETIEKIIRNNRAPIAAHQIWAESQNEKRLTTFIDRQREVTSADEIPERVYRALRRRFDPQHFRIL